MLLKEVATKYYNFLAKVGASEDDSFMESEASEIFTPNVKKIVNGVCVADGLGSLLASLREARKNVFPWSSTALGDDGLCVDTEKNIATLCYELSATGMGTFLVMKNLKVIDGKISNIYEVYNKKAEEVASNSR